MQQAGGEQAQQAQEMLKDQVNTFVKLNKSISQGLFWGYFTSRKWEKYVCKNIPCLFISFGEFSGLYF